jgi:hypothetical protein
LETSDNPPIEEQKASIFWVRNNFNLLDHSHVRTDSKDEPILVPKKAPKTWINDELL